MHGAKNIVGEMTETELYPPIKSLLESMGYAVQAEVKHCDVVAKRGEDLLIIELKTSFNLSLVYQGVKRQEITQRVYLAVPVTGSRSYPPNWRNMSRLLKRLGLGLILVRFLRSGARVEIALEAGAGSGRPRRRGKQGLLEELAGRKADANSAGSVRREIMTAYREEALRIACFLSVFGPLSPKRLKDFGCGEKTASILYNNYYGWFERQKKGIYALNNKGKKRLKDYGSLSKGFIQEAEQLWKKGDGAVNGEGSRPDSG